MYLRAFISIIVINLLIPAYADENCQRVQERGSSELYKDRGDRCEGVYEQRVGLSTSLRIVGYQLNRPADDFSEQSKTRILFSPSDNRSITVVSLRVDDYYQMDTRAFDEDTFFDWTMNVIRRVSPPIPSSMIVGVSCIRECTSEPSATPHLTPLVFEGAELAPAPYVVLQAMRDVSSLRASLFDDEGDEVFVDRRIGPRHMTVGRSAWLRLEDAPDGWNTLEIRGQRAGGSEFFLSAKLLVGEED